MTNTDEKAKKQMDMTRPCKDTLFTNNKCLCKEKPIFKSPKVLIQYTEHTLGGTINSMEK